MKKIATDAAPAAIGPYSQAVEHNGTLYCSGQIGLDPESMELKTGLLPQLEQITANIDAVLEAAGKTKQDIIKTTIFVTDISRFAEVNEVYGAWLGTHTPARSTVAVAGLPKGAEIEIEVIAAM